MSFTAVSGPTAQQIFPEAVVPRISPLRYTISVPAFRFLFCYGFQLVSIWAITENNNLFAPRLAVVRPIFFRCLFPEYTIQSFFQRWTFLPPPPPKGAKRCPISSGQSYRLPSKASCPPSLLCFYRGPRRCFVRPTGPPLEAWLPRLLGSPHSFPFSDPSWFPPLIADCVGRSTYCDRPVHFYGS